MYRTDLVFKSTFFNWRTLSNQNSNSDMNVIIKFSLWRQENVLKLITHTHYLAFHIHIYLMWRKTRPCKLLPWNFIQEKSMADLQNYIPSSVMFSNHWISKISFYFILKNIRTLPYCNKSQDAGKKQYRNGLPRALQKFYIVYSFGNLPVYIKNFGNCFSFYSSTTSTVYYFCTTF